MPSNFHVHSKPSNQPPGSLFTFWIFALWLVREEGLFQGGLKLFFAVGYTPVKVLLAMNYSLMLQAHAIRFF